MASTHKLASKNCERSSPQNASQNTQNLLNLIGAAHSGHEELKTNLLRNAVGLAAGIVGAGLTACGFWLLRESWPEQTAMLLLVVTLAFSVLTLVAFCGFIGAAGESYLVHRLKLESRIRLCRP